MSNKRINKAYVRYDGTGRVIPGSLILNRFKPQVGNWKETPAYECCNDLPIPLEFNVTADWTLSSPAVVDEASFRQFLENGYDGDGNPNILSDVIIENFTFNDLGNGYQQVTCNLLATANSDNNNNYYDLFLTYLDIISIEGIGNILKLEALYLYGNLLTEFDIPLPTSLVVINLAANEIVTFNPTNPLPKSLIELSLNNNQITVFNPSQPLPKSLQRLYLRYNQIVTFNPTIALPSSLQTLYLTGNQIVTFNPSQHLPNSLQSLDLGENQIVTFNPSIVLSSSLRYLFLNDNQIVTFNPSIALPSFLETLSLYSNSIVTFNPSIALPNSLIELELNNNQIITFNPSIALPSSLQYFNLSSNRIVIFNPSISLPNSIYLLFLDNNLMTTTGYTASESWANAMSVIPSRGDIYIYNNVNSIGGTTLETILISKGWNLNY